VSILTCFYPGCGESYAKPLWGRERITNRPVALCPFCKGRVGRPSEMRSK
jgi:hypothetical protein